MATSRGIDYFAVEGLCGSGPWRERGFFPRPIIRAASDRRGFHHSVEHAERILPYTSMGDNNSVEIPALDLVIARMMCAESHYTFWQPLDLKSRRDGGRPERTKSKTLFKRCPKGAAPNIKPLSVKHGVAALERLVERCKALKICVSEDVARAIRGRTTRPTDPKVQ
jgi:hypothetical protein